MIRTLDIIRSQLDALTQHESFKTWSEDGVPARDGLAVLNNSYLFRESTRSAKSSLYVAFKVAGGAVDLSKPLVATRRTRQNVDFQFVQSASVDIREANTLDEVVADLLGRFGRVGFVLIGELHDDLGFDAALDADGPFARIVLDPSCPDAVQVRDDSVYIRDLVDEEVLWQELSALAPNQADDELAGALAKALAELREKSYARLILPTSEAKGTNTLLDNISVAFETAVDEYRLSLQACDGDSKKNNDAFTNLLRIAYNFTSDAVDLVKFVVDMSDLKPLILFLTINAQFKLALALQSLPTRRMDHKPSLKLYQETVSNARSGSFHRLFPFSKAIEVDVTGLSFQARRLRLFPEYHTRSKNAVDYEDRELVEAMTKFARPTGYSLAPVFWMQNLKVMEATVNLLHQLKEGLVAVRADCH